MKFEDFVDIAQTIKPGVNPNDVSLRLESYYDDLAMEVDLELAKAYMYIEDGQEEYEMTSFLDLDTDEPIADVFVRMKGIYLNDAPIRYIGEALPGDDCYKVEGDALIIGTLSGPVNGSNLILPRQAGAKILMIYSKRPNLLMLEEGQLPLKIAHSALTYRLRADMWAEQARWDLYGSYNRRYEQSFVRIKKHLRSGHGGWNPVNVRI